MKVYNSKCTVVCEQMSRYIWQLNWGGNCTKNKLQQECKTCEDNICEQ